MATRRLQYVDIARGIAMICIVLGHLDNQNINRVVFTFHVPLFFFITGYFINAKLSVQDFIKSKVRTLIIPYVCTCCIIIFLGTAKGFLTEGLYGAGQSFVSWLYASLYGAGDSYTEPFYIKGIGAIWFLLATFWGSIFLRMTLNMSKIKRLSSIIALFCVGYITHFLVWAPFSIQAGCCAVFFMYIGYQVRQLQDLFRFMSNETRIGIGIFALLVWISFIKDFQSFWLVHCDIGRGIIDIFGCICACYIVLLISKWIEKYCDILKHSLSFLGKYSVFMLCVHIIELDLFPWTKVIQKIMDIGIPVEFELYILIILKFMFILPCTILCARVSFVKKIFGIKE